MATNGDVGTLNKDNEERQPVSTDVVIPGENVVVDHWVVSSGSAVRARETIAYVRKRSEGNSCRATVATVAAPKHKRPTRRKKSAKRGIDTQGKSENQGNGKSNGSSLSAKTSTAVGKNYPQVAKNSLKTEPCSIVNQSKDESEAKSQENKKESASAPKLTAKTKQIIPIHAPATGILRICDISRQNTDGQPQRRLVVGVIEECICPTFVDGMCVVCGLPRASTKENQNSQGTTNRGTSQVTVSGGITMTVSQRESENMALLDARRLFGQKRLSLVLDLDHTLVHATADARARQFLDPAAGDVRIISLPMFEGADAGTKKGIDPRHKQMRSKHYVKLRPYVKEFLEGVYDTYEVSV